VRRLQQRLGLADSGGGHGGKARGQGVELGVERGLGDGLGDQPRRQCGLGVEALAGQQPPGGLEPADGGRQQQGGGGLRHQAELDEGQLEPG
jgi:hypothetical protein